jgi:hypothetical protein
MIKRCSKCKEDKDLSQFAKYKNGKLGAHHYCKPCHSEQRKRTYDYSKSRNRRILHSYNINIDTIESVYISQGGCCKICNKKYSTFSKHGGLYIDHCHTTGKVRGLLCAKCNGLLGSCNDNISVLQNAIEYLKLNS